MRLYACPCSACLGEMVHASTVADHACRQQHPHDAIYTQGLMNKCPFCGYNWGDLSVTKTAVDRQVTGKHFDKCPKYKLAVVAGRLL